MFKRRSNIFILYVALNMAFFFLIFAHAYLKKETDMPIIMEKALLVERLELTDLCLFTDARYTRNPSMADLHTPFQDNPLSMEHFPSGTFILPPPHLHP